MQQRMGGERGTHNWRGKATTAASGGDGGGDGDGARVWSARQMENDTMDRKARFSCATRQSKL